MTRTLAVFIVGLLVTAGSLAQLPGMQGGRSDALEGEAKLRWVIERLELDKEQQQLAEDLIELYHAEIEEAKKNTVQILRRIQTKMAEIDEAEAAGDMERAQRLRTELAEMAPVGAAEKMFYDSLKEVLSPEQKARVAKLREQVKTVRKSPQPTPRQQPAEQAEVAQPIQPQQPSAPAEPQEELRPASVLRAVLAVKLTVAQRAELEKVLANFRQGMRTNPPRGEADRTEKVKELIRGMTGLLDEAQREMFFEKVGRTFAEQAVADGDKKEESTEPAVTP